MGKTWRNFPQSTHRKPKGKRNAKINGVRKKAIPPDSWADIIIGEEAWIPYKATRKMLESNMDDDQIVHRLVNKFHLKHYEAIEVLRHVKQNFKIPKPNDYDSIR